MTATDAAQPADITPPRHNPVQDWLIAAAITAALTVLTIYSASRTSLFDRDEPRYARATVEMLDSGDYMIPYFNYDVRSQKPVGIYWMMAVPMGLFGQGELACRAVSIACMAATMLVTFGLGRRLLGSAGGLWALLVLGTSPLAMAMAKMCTTDAALLLFIMLAVACYVPIMQRRGGFRWWAGFCVFSGAAIYIKGPLGLVPLGVVGFALILQWLWKLHPPLLRHGLWASVASVVAVGLFCIWGIPAVMQKPELMHEGMGYHVGTRFTQAVESHGGNGWKYLAWLPFYVAVTAVGFFPWILPLHAGLARAFRKRLAGPQTSALVLSMALTMLIAATIVPTKMAHYALPAWPGLALLVGGAIAAATRGELDDTSRKWLGRGIYIFLILGLSGMVLSIAGPWLLLLPSVKDQTWLAPLHQLRWPCLLVGLQIGAMTIGSAVLLKQRKLPAAGVVMAVGVLLIDLTIHSLVVGPVEQVKASNIIAEKVNESVEPDAVVATYGFYEPTIDFYLDRRKRIPAFAAWGAEPEAVLAWLSQDAPGALIVTDSKLAALEEIAGDLDTDARVIARAEGVHPTNIVRPLRLIALRRGPIDGYTPTADPAAERRDLLHAQMAETQPGDDISQ